jgi:L-asparaginase
MRGNRTIKMDADGFKAFHSPNYPLLGEAGINISINKKLIRKKENSSDKFSVRVLKDMQIGTLRLFPGIAVDFIEKILESPLKGLVIEGYGAGNGPVANPEFIRVLKNATERGVIIAASTQCTKGVVDLKSYQTGTLLEKAGLIGGYDMTTEALIGKLFYLLSIDGLSNEKIKEMMQQNLRGEMLSDLQ